MRSDDCPICARETAALLTMHFGLKLRLPTKVVLRHCSQDNFIFVANGDQQTYDEYYQGVANDTVHQEVAGQELRSPIAKIQLEYLQRALVGFFENPRKVLDFGCGAASLLLELATAFPESEFHGFDPGPAAAHGAQSARSLGLTNVTIEGLPGSLDAAPFDLIVVSHVMEHIIDFDVIVLLKSLLAEDGLIYVEVPDALRYSAMPRLEFLYYFDRLHVNHFTPTALAGLFRNYGFVSAGHFTYNFPYRDGDDYPALGMFFRNATELDTQVRERSDDVLAMFSTYLRDEQVRACERAETLGSNDGILVYGAGDNFYRSVENGGPLAGKENLVVLVDRDPFEISVRTSTQQTVNPEAAIRAYPWPVVITISEGREDVAKRVREIDPKREVIFL